MAFWFEPVPFFQHPAAKVFAQFRECLQNCHQARFPMPPTPTQLVSSVASFPATLIFRTLLRPPYPIFTSPVLQQKTFYSLAVSPPCCGYTSVYIYTYTYILKEKTQTPTWLITSTLRSFDSPCFFVAPRIRERKREQMGSQSDSRNARSNALENWQWPGTVNHLEAQLSSKCWIVLLLLYIHIYLLCWLL